MVGNGTEKNPIWRPVPGGCDECCKLSFLIGLIEAAKAFQEITPPYRQSGIIADRRKDSFHQS
jgi:hypothetical protein